MSTVKSKYDKAIVYWKKDAVLQGIIACHVDDFIFSGTALFMDNVVKSLKQKFKVSAQSEDRLTCIVHKMEKEDMNLVNQKRNEEKNRKLKREGAEKKRKRRRIQLSCMRAPCPI